jgi:hypothetical protein
VCWVIVIRWKSPVNGIRFKSAPRPVTASAITTTRVTTTAVTAPTITAVHAAQAALPFVAFTPAAASVTAGEADVDHSEHAAKQPTPAQPEWPGALYHGPGFPPDYITFREWHPTPRSTYQPGAIANECAREAARTHGPRGAVAAPAQVRRYYIETPVSAPPAQPDWRRAFHHGCSLPPDHFTFREYHPTPGSTYHPDAIADERAQLRKREMRPFWTSSG